VRGFPSYAIALLVCVTALVGGADRAVADDRTEDRLKALEDRIRVQDEEIGKLRSELAETRRGSEDFESQLDEYFGKLEEEGAWQEPGTLLPQWSKGTRLSSNDKQTEIKFGGRVMIDLAWFDPSNRMKENLGEFPNSSGEFRRARLYVSGTIYGNVFFKAQYDFAGGDVDWKDVYLGLKKVPVVGNIRVGNQKVPFSLEELTSSKYITFMERALPVEAFAPSRKLGIAVYNSELEGNLNWALMWFTGSDDYGDSKSALESSFAGRVAWAVVNEDKGRDLIHLGVSLVYRDPLSDSARYRARPSAHLSPHRIVDSKSFGVDDAMLFGFEFAWVMDSLSVQLEWMYVSNNSNDDSGDPNFMGGYVYVSYWLTGEHRPYKKGTFSRVKPSENLTADGGMGAWELALRYARVDLDDFPNTRVEGEPVYGDVLTGAQNITFGVNWHWNPNTRMMFNYVWNDTDDVGGLNVFEIRFQIDF